MRFVSIKQMNERNWRYSGAGMPWIQQNYLVGAQAETVKQVARSCLL